MSTGCRDYESALQFYSARYEEERCPSTLHEAASRSSGAGPGGMAAALAAHRSGFDVALYERYPEIKAAGNILNLWPPPQKILRLIGVDTDDLGAPANATFRRSDGRVRAVVNL